ncbi:LysE family translocator [Aestuariibacter sp. AA17]|uniref:LysE family translocator n=1 Tax=Fluctibacter corallii TaxID=2984329 RepID=A0ABT3A7G0_9ALTE|nr:LysE family translocator [Aestuariibacter sp. AA17]MCV2884625.1 LysE family translocator [Aestuariibacter sp. AA17]
MPPLESLLAFALAALILSLSPGPSNLYIMARALGQGYQAGVAAAGGMAIGSLTYALATALGLAVVFTYSPMAYLAIKVGGAGYLIYLGWKYIRYAQVASPDKPHVSFLAPKAILKQSFIVEMTNPKTALFLLAFLPQFVSENHGNVISQMLVLGCIYTCIALASDLFVVFLSRQVGKWLATHPRFSFWQERISGSILMLLGSLIMLESINENTPFSENASTSN